MGYVLHDPRKQACSEENHSGQEQNRFKDRNFQ